MCHIEEVIYTLPQGLFPMNQNIMNNIRNSETYKKHFKAYIYSLSHAPFSSIDVQNIMNKNEVF